MSRQNDLRENKVRVNITMSPTIKCLVESESYKMGLSSSAFITLCINHYFMQTQSLAKFGDNNIMDVMNRFYEIMQIDFSKKES